jgi:hypothetical protein
VSHRAIQLSLQQDDAAAFDAFPPSAKAALVNLLQRITHSLLQKDPRSLEQIMDDVSTKAEAAGLTEERLRELLSE